MILQHNSSLSSESFLLESNPTREKFHLELHLASEEILTVNMLIPLDARCEDEKRAREMFRTDTLPLRYRVKLNLDSERTEFAKLIRSTYRSELGTILRQDELAPLDADDLRKLMRPLIEQGRNIFFRLFLSDRIEYEQYTEEDREVVQAAVRSALSRRQVFSIFSPAPLFPWAFLYYDDDYEPSNRASIRPERIWGFMHEIQEEFDMTAQRVSLPADVKILSAVDTDVDVQNWHSAQDHPFSQVKPKSANSIDDLGMALGNFDENCFYFFGHADHTDPPTQASSWLELRKMRLTVSNMDIQFKAPRFKKSPVVAFLNGCRTSPLTLWNEDTVVGFLCFRGKKRLCCVASVGELPPAFAAEFAKNFWEEFLIIRQPIGSALLHARTFMLQKWNNPLGLLYSLFGRVDTFIENAQETTVTEDSKPS